MFTRKQWCFTVLIMLTAMALLQSCNKSSEKDGYAEQNPDLPGIAGLTSEDKYPEGCVDCHANFVEKKFDERLSTKMSKWIEKVEPALLEKAQASAPDGVILVGKHPDVLDKIRLIPDDCLKCHQSNDNPYPKKPLFKNLIHRIHLVGGKDNHYITMTQGNCMPCHKLDQNTGSWSMCSGAEK